jgi:hypothetical protein
MQLANLRNFKFSNFSFYQYFFTVYIGLHVTFSILLGNITAFAPDEGLYKEIFSKLYSTGFTSDVLGFSGAWEPWLRLIYLPAKLLTYLGFTRRPLLVHWLFSTRHILANQNGER